MITYSLNIEIKAAESWTKDGFDPTSPEWKTRLEEAIVALLPYAYDHEFKVVVTSAERTTPEYKAGDMVVIPNDLTRDPNNKRGHIGEIESVEDFDEDDTILNVKFADGKVGKYAIDAVKMIPAHYLKS